MDKVYKSRFVSDLDITIDSFIAESIMLNHIAFLSRKNNKINKPTCAFWRNDIAKNDNFLLELKTRYINELTYVKNLLKVFSPKVIINYINARGITTFRYQVLNKQQIIIYNLFNDELKHQKAVKEQAGKVQKLSGDLVTTVEKKKTQKTKLSGVLD